jgi:hypothetical protein
MRIFERIKIYTQLGKSSASTPHARAISIGIGLGILYLVPRKFQGTKTAAESWGMEHSNSTNKNIRTLLETPIFKNQFNRHYNKLPYADL